MFLQSGIVGHSREDSKKLISKFLPVSIILFKEDFDDKKDLQSLVKEINRSYVIEHGVKRPYIAIDQEGGKVVQIPWIEYNPSNAFLGSYGNIAFTKLVGSRVGYDLKLLGLSWQMAPDLDLANRYNPVISERSFSSEIQTVSAHGSAYINGLQEAGIAATAKHFPCHGGVAEDSHKVLPDDKRSRNAIMSDTKPFLEAMSSKVASIMMGHVRYPSIDPDYPASLSLKFYDLVRRYFGYQGVLVTDSVDMGAVVKGYSNKEIAKLASGGGADVIETVDIDQAIEINDFLNMKDPKGSIERINKLIPQKRLAFEPPADLIKSIAMVNNYKLRINRFLDPNEETFLYFLEAERGSMVEEVFSNEAEVFRRLGNRFQIMKYNPSSKKKVKQIIIVGRNEHIKSRIGTILESAKNRNAFFLSTGIPADLGLFQNDVSYVSLLSTKVESILGGIYRAFNLF